MQDPLESDKTEERACFACGALAPDSSGPIHPYIESSPGCWLVYCELQSWTSSLVGFDGVTTAQYLVDAYSAQHATNSGRRNRQSVTVHLMSLCAQLELGITATALRTMMGLWTHRDYPILEPRPTNFPITVRTVLDEANARRPRVVEAMARSTWDAWSPHHAALRPLLAGSLP